MNLNILNRKVHYWAAIIIAIPFLIVLGTGILLQLKKQLPWVQPPAQRGTGNAPTISFADILQEAKRQHPAITGWVDIDRLDVRPSRGIVKVRVNDHWELQIDAQTGKLLPNGKAYRRSDIIESIHDGSWFHDSVKLWVFLPAALILLGMWGTGMYLFWLPIVIKRRRRRQRAQKLVANKSSN